MSVERGSRWGRLKVELRFIGTLLTLWLVAVSFLIAREDQVKTRDALLSLYEDNQTLRAMLAEARSAARTVADKSK